MSGARINYSGFNISQTDTCEHLSCGFECGLSDLALLFGGGIFMHDNLLIFIIFIFSFNNIMVTAALTCITCAHNVLFKSINQHSSGRTSLRRTGFRTESCVSIRACTHQIINGSNYYKDIFNTQNT